MRIYNDLIFDQTVASTTNSDYFVLGHIFGFSCQAVWDVNTPTGKAFTDANITAATDSIAITAHTMVTGLKGQLTTSGVLPTGLAAATDYFVIKVDASTIKLASSLSNALAGTAIDIAADGSGTHTFTATSIAGGSALLQVTNDDASDPKVTPTWFDLSGAQSVTADGSNMFNYADCNYAFGRFRLVLTAGQVAMTARINCKGF